MSKKLYVGNIPTDCKAYELQALFERYGKVTECDILSDFGFVHFDKTEDASRAAESLNGWEFQGKVIRVEVSKNQFKSGKFRPMGPITRHDSRDHRTGRPHYDTDPYPSDYYDSYYQRDPYGGSRPPPPPPSRYYEDRWYDYERHDPYYAERRSSSYYSRYSPPPPPPPPPREYRGYEPPPPRYRSRSRSPPYRRPEPYSSYYDNSYREPPPPRSGYSAPLLPSAGPPRRRTPPPRSMRPPLLYDGYHTGAM